MKSSEVIGALKASIKATKDNGASSISITGLEEYIGRLEKASKESPDNASAGEAAMEAFKADLNSKLSLRQQKHENQLEMLKATVSTAQMALKSALLINSGASVAMLAFIGNVWIKAFNLDNVLNELANSLCFFVFGVLAAAIATAFTYFTQASYAGEFGKYSNKMGIAAHIMTVLVVIASYVLFANGSLSAFHAIVPR